MTSRIYLDHAATTPLRPQSAAAQVQAQASWANPSSPHAEGRAARAVLEDARRRIAAALGWGGEVILTAGASEAAAIAMGQSKAAHCLVSAVEHDAVLKASAKAQIIAVGNDGGLNRDALAAALDGLAGSALIAVQSINSETGNRQDMAAIKALLRPGDMLLVDASQSAGKFPLPVEADAVIVSAHKLGGPIGIGALLLRDYALLHPSGGQERGYRRGTENVPAAAALAAALEACETPYCRPDVLEPIETHLAPAIVELGGLRLADLLADHTPYIEAIAMPELSGSAQLMRFDMKGFAVSQGSACSSGSLRGSHVLEAMGLDADVAARTIRVSFGWNTTRAEVEAFCAEWIAMARSACGKTA
ncbi:aminotransferase class V-fold PLP-dependent enzyme [Altericroceibacterium endophyticum]|uniref:Cysteine desulfurase n=1 Tax=Altericroceibacterium endophyticum TaxID=1808508 RepID=A0A6I4SZL4_9SPHN|nr:aminotransferase class V-fold PLP-dependent enzyme [Altericroceibacterium endophyticum]